MSILGKVWNTFRNFIGGISGIWCIIIIAALDIQIFCRSFLGFSTTWSEEVAELCFVGLIFCYLAQCEKEGAHLQLEILFQIWPKLKFYMDVAGKSICISPCARKASPWELRLFSGDIEKKNFFRQKSFCSNGQSSIVRKSISEDRKEEKRRNEKIFRRAKRSKKAKGALRGEKREKLDNRREKFGKHSKK